MRRLILGLVSLSCCGGPQPDVNSRDPLERYLGAKELAWTRDFGKLVPLLDDRHQLVVLGALEAIAAIGEPHSLQHVVPKLRHGHPLVRQQACITIGALRNEEGLAALLEALKDADPAVRRQAVKSMASFGGRPDVVKALVGALGDPDPSVAFMAHLKLGELTGLSVEERSVAAWERALENR